MARELSSYSDLKHIAEPFDPAGVDEVCFPSASVEGLIRLWCARQGATKNLLMYGPPGSGKTRAAYILAEHRIAGRAAEWKPLRYVECESGTFDLLFQGLKSEYTVFPRLDDPEYQRIVILDEVDNFKPDQQKQLKKVLERADMAFVLLTNNVPDLDAGLRNRCLEVSWHVPAPDVCLPRLRQLAAKAGCTAVADEVLLREVYSVAGWRQMLRNLDAVTSRQ